MRYLLGVIALALVGLPGVAETNASQYRLVSGADLVVAGSLPIGSESGSSGSLLFVVFQGGVGISELPQGPALGSHARFWLCTVSCQPATANVNLSKDDQVVHVLGSASGIGDVSISLEPSGQPAFDFRITWRSGELCTNGQTTSLHHQVTVSAIGVPDVSSATAAAATGRIGAWQIVEQADSAAVLNAMVADIGQRAWTEEC